MAWLLYVTVNTHNNTYKQHITPDDHRRKVNANAIRISSRSIKAFALLHVQRDITCYMFPYVRMFVSFHSLLTPRPPSSTSSDSTDTSTPTSTSRFTSTSRTTQPRPPQAQPPRRQPPGKKRQEMCHCGEQCTMYSGCMCLCLRVRYDRRMRVCYDDVHV